MRRLSISDKAAIGIALTIVAGAVLGGLLAPRLAPKCVRWVEQPGTHCRPAGMAYHCGIPNGYCAEYEARHPSVER